MSIKSEFIEKLSFEKSRDNEYRVSLKKDKDDYSPDFCTVTKSDYDKHWRVTETRPNKYLDFIRYVQFPNKEEAAWFCYGLMQTAEKVANERPLPDSVERYLYDRARSLDDELQHLKGEIYRIHNERYTLLKFAKENKLGNVAYMTEDSDREKMVRDLLDLKVYIEQEKDEIPFFSEGSLYNLIGKDDARGVRALLHRVCDLLAPGIFEESRL